jgi:hypothetical protein
VGDPQDPLSWEELVGKYRECTGRVLPQQQVDRSLELIEDLEKIRIEALTRKVYAFNRDLSRDRWIRWGGFIVMNVVWIYAAAGLIDVVFAVPRSTRGAARRADCSRARRGRGVRRGRSRDQSRRGRASAVSCGTTCSRSAATLAATTPGRSPRG